MNYGEGFDDIIDENGKAGNALPPAANSKMEEHYKKMYGDEIQVRDIVEILDGYKHSRDSLDQDVFACMIHGLFDEYTHYVDYPLEALATTAVLFGGIISHKLISDLPLKVGLGMILEAVRDHAPDASMYKFGLQALMQLFSRLWEWPGFCKQLLQIPGLQGTEAWKKAEDVVRDHEEDIVRTRHANSVPDQGSPFSPKSIANGVAEEALNSDRQAPPFTSINFDPHSQGVEYEDPSSVDQGRIQFSLNNLTETTLKAIHADLRDVLERKHQHWFASHLVQERAKMQPNYHHVYLELVHLFEDTSLWAQVLRETYGTVARILNAEATMQSSSERTHLKNLGGWLGLLTLARDRPIKHRNIAFKRLLMEAHDTKRLVVVIPFVCKVLIQGARSTIFRPPNPWLMDIVHLLIDLYHHAELKLNLKFEIEVLCKGLNLDHKNIEPSGEILHRAAVEEPGEQPAHDPLDTFDSLSLNGLAPVGHSGLSPQVMAPTIPDVGPMLHIPPTNEMVVSATRLHEIVRTALSRALADIIQPVVERSVTIAAISTHQMIHKDFAIESDETRLRTSAINMVKATAGSLALVTSKEPLRSNFTNYMRNLSVDLPQGLPEGTIIMCVNSNLDIGCSIIEKQAEERAVPEIEEMIEPELENRRRHRVQKPMEPFVGPSLDRWASAIPEPFRLVEGMRGLTPEQMAIYEDFARQSRSTTTPTASHAASASDATRSLAAEVLQEQFAALPAIPTPSETPSVQHTVPQILPYHPFHPNSSTNGRPSAFHLDVQVIAARFQKLLLELQRVATEAREEHFVGLPRPHPVLDVVDALVQLIIKASQSSEEIAAFGADQISQLIFSQVDDNLALESLVHVLETLRKISGPSITARVKAIFHQQPGHFFLQLPLLTALTRTDLIEWKSIDTAMAKVLAQRKDGSLEFLARLMDLALLNERPLALYADFIRTLEAAWTWILDDPDNTAGQEVKDKLLSSGLRRPSSPSEVESSMHHQDQMEYIFDEWVRVCSNPNATDKVAHVFLQQIRLRRIVASKDDFFLFVRIAVDHSVDSVEHLLQSSGEMPDGYLAVDALARLIAMFVRMHPDADVGGKDSPPAFLESTVAFIALLLHHHHLKRGDHFNQRAFYRLLSMTLHEVSRMTDHLSATDRRDMMVGFAASLVEMGPRQVPGFMYGWLSLIQHRTLLPTLLMSGDPRAAQVFTELIGQLLTYLGDHLKGPEASPVTRDLYRATLKFLAVLQHDFPEYVAAHHNELCRSIPPHCGQLLGVLLSATPTASPKFPDPMHAGLKMDRMEELQDVPKLALDPGTILRRHGLLGILDQALQVGPSEGGLAHIAHTLSYSNAGDTTFGRVPARANLAMIDALIVYVANYAVGRAASTGGPMFSPSGSDATTLALLVHEVHPDTRYHIISSMVNQLRFPNAHTWYFSLFLLNLFGQDPNDPEESEVRQQIVRVVLERIVGFWPQPWGLLVTVVEMMKNDKVMFFDLPFIKSAPEVWLI
jgi:CCR4-NOT transcription complex subunit 1